MRDDDPNLKISEDKPESSRVSRRDFLKISGISVAVPLVAGPRTVLAAGQEVPVYGPGKVPMEFAINGKNYKANLEPRVTLLDALRDQFEFTGAKRVCDRAECGACTVLMDNKTVYACSVLAIEAQHKPIVTVESLMQEGKLHPVQQAFVENDASQCGFCTPGFVISGKVLRCPYAHAKVVSIDSSAAEKMPGVKAIHIVQGPGSNIHWAGDDIVAVAAVDEPTAEDAIRAIKVEFQQLPYLVSDAEPPKGSAQEEGPLSIDAIDDMLDNQVPANQMVSIIQRDGLI